MEIERTDPTAASAPASGGAVAAGQALLGRAFAWMFVGLALTAGIAAWFASNGATLNFFEDNPGVFFALMIAELGLVVWIGAGLRRISAQTATVLFCLYAGLNGVVFSVIFSVYTSAEIAPAFGVAAGMFGAMALYGYVTERDLDNLGSFLFMGLIGLLLAMVVNLIWASSALYWVTTFAGVAIFMGLTAWDVQKLKRMGAERGGEEAEKWAVFGALMLYLDFVNIFLFLLRIFGGSR